MKRRLISVWAVLVAAFSVGAQPRGDLVSIEEVAALSHEEVRETVVDLGDGLIPESLVDLLVPTPFDVKAYRIVYRTIDGRGRPTVASGLAVMPQGYPHRMAMVTYHHGTFADDASAPSNLGLEAVLGYGLASSGYVMVLPDYLGFGANPGIHPYVHAGTAASAAIDMMRAVRTAARYGGYRLNGQVFLTGYSQGGHAAVATMREIERNHLNEFNLVMTAAGSGPYSLANIQFRFAAGNPQYPTRSYLPFLLLGYQDIYGNLYDSLDDVFVPPYNELIPTLFDRQHTMGQINQALPRNWREMFVPEYLSAVETNPFHPARAALRDSDLVNFRPKTPLLMFYCTKDEQVDYRNALWAQFYYKYLQRATTRVSAIGLGPFEHGGVCVGISMGLARLNFDALRTQ